MWLETERKGLEEGRKKTLGLLGREDWKKIIKRGEGRGGRSERSEVGRGGPVGVNPDQHPPVVGLWIPGVVVGVLQLPKRLTDAALRSLLEPAWLMLLGLPGTDRYPYGVL